MRALGYDGVDVRGLDERLDNTGMGSVVYRDLLPDLVEVGAIQDAELPEEPSLRLSHEQVIELINAPPPAARGPVTDLQGNVIEGVTYTPKLKRPVTALDFYKRGEMWVGDRFFAEPAGIRVNMLAQEFGQQLAKLAESEVWFNDRNAWGEHGDEPQRVNFAYGEAYYEADDRDWEFLGTEGGRQTVALALRVGFPVHPEVEQWAHGNVPEPERPPEPPEPDAGSPSDELQELLTTLRKTNNSGFAHNMLTDKIGLGGTKLGYLQTDHRIEDGDTVVTYRNYDQGTTITMRTNGSDIINMEAVTQAIDLSRNPTPGTPEHDAKAVIGVPFEEAKQTLAERGYHLTNIEGAYTPAIGGWHRFTTADGRSILVKPSGRGHRKVTAAYPDHASTEAVEEAQAAARAADPHGGFREGAAFDMLDLNAEGMEGWTAGDLDFAEGRQVLDLTHPEHGPLRIVADTTSGKIVSVGRPDPSTGSLLALSDDDYQAALESTRADMTPLQRFADELVGETRQQLYQREQFQARMHDEEGGSFAAVDDAPGAVGETVWKNHDTGETLVLTFNTGGNITEARSYTTDYPRRKGEVAGGQTNAGKLADNWRVELHEPDVTAKAFQDAMVEHGYIDVGSEGSSWTRYTHAHTGESIVAKFEGGSSWDTALLTAVYEDETGDRARYKARGKWLMVNPVERIKPGDDETETGAALITGGGIGRSWRRYEIEGRQYGEWLHPMPGSARRIRIRFEDGKVAEIGYKPPGDANEADKTTILSPEAFDIQQQAIRQQADEVTARRNEIAAEDFTMRSNLIAERKAPAKVGEPGNEVISRLRAHHRFDLRSRKRVRYTKAEWEKQAKATGKPFIPGQRPPFKGWSYVLRDNNGHTLRLVVGGETPAGASFLGLPVAPGKAAIQQVEWTPAPDLDRTRLTRPPTSKDEVIADTLGRADELGRQHGGVDVQVPTVIMRSSKPDHSGHHEQNGTIVAGEAVWPDIKRAIAKLASDEPLTKDEALSAYSAYQTLQHEVNHGVNAQGVGSSETYQVGMEEALTEELSHPQTVEWLRSMGMDEVAQHVRNSEGHYEVKGVYWHHRRRFRELLHQANVPEGERRTLMEKMKFNMDTEERVSYMAGLIAAHRGISQEEAERAVRGKMSYRKSIDRRSALKGHEFEPILSLEAELEGIEPPLHAGRVANGEIRLGQEVNYPPSAVLPLRREGYGVIERFSPDGERAYVREQAGVNSPAEWRPTAELRLPPTRVGYAASSRVADNPARSYHDSTADVGDPVFVENFTSNVNPQVGEVVELDGQHADVRVRVQTVDGEADMWFGPSHLYRADQPILRDSRDGTGGPLVLPDGTVVKYGTVMEGVAVAEGQLTGEGEPRRFWAIGGGLTGTTMDNARQVVIGLVENPERYDLDRLNFDLGSVRVVEEPVAEAALVGA